MKATLLIFAAAVLVSPLHAGGIKPPQVNLIAKFIKNLEDARKQGLVTDISAWSDIEGLLVELQGRLLGSYSPKIKNISDYFVIVPKSDRFKIQGDIMFIVSAHPFNLTKWNRDISSKNATSRDERDAVLAEYDAMHPDDKMVRWCGVKTAKGSFDFIELPEPKFQELSKLHQFRVPEVQVYRFNLSKVAQEYTEREAALPDHDPASSKEAPEIASAPIAKQPSMEPKNPWKWVVGLALLSSIGVALLLRKRISASHDKKQ